MNEEILLTSEEFVKSVSSISDNIAGKYILSSIREAQEDGLREILGDLLLDTLKAKYADGTLDGAYRDLVEQSQYYLAYMAQVKILFKVTMKVTNFGVVKSSDENLQVAPTDDIFKLQNKVQAEADRYCRKLQQWILRHYTDFPELHEWSWTVAHQAPPSMGFSRQEYCSGLPCPPPGDLPNPGIEPTSPALQAGSLPLSHQGNSFPT